MTTSNEVTERALYDAVAKLIKAKGRFHTEQNYAALVKAFDACTPTVPAIPRTSAEAVLWVESEPSTRLLDLSEVIQGTCHTVMYHISEPRTSNPVWPLYKRATPAPADSTELRNFCARCGKATPPGSIHTCTAPADSAAERDAARLAHIERKHVMGSSYGGITSLNVIVHCDDYAVGGALYAIDCMVERETGNAPAALHTNTGEKA